MLLSSINTFNYALDVVTNNEQTELVMDKNTYKNLNQDENKEEEINNSTAINFNDITESTSIEENNNDNDNINNTSKKKKEKKFDIDYIFVYVSKFLKFLGPLFCITIFTFLIYTYISVIKNIFPYWYKNFISYENHKMFYNIYKYLIFFELLSTLFNHVLAIIIKPGSVQDLRNSKYYKEHSAYYSDNFKITPFFIRNNNLNHQEMIWKICKYCKEIKPLRTHHCSLCDICVIKMDHHCPWINNCVGQNNQRYFLLFLFHSFCYTFLVTILTLPILLFHKKYSQNDTEVIITKNKVNMREIKYISILGIVSLIVEIFFCGWNWFLAFNGQTTLEFWASKTDYKFNEGIVNFSFGNWKKNLFYIFGTENIFKILFFPHVKKLPFSGLEFSKYVDKNFFIDGI
jgi:hypothetical protein